MIEQKWYIAGKHLLILNIKELKTFLRNSNIIYEPKFEKVTYGKNYRKLHLKYYGSNIWRIFYQMKLRKQQTFYLLKVYL